MRAPSSPPRLRRLRRDRAGNAVIEFAVIAPLMIILAGGAVDIGIAIDRSIRLEAAARAGAQYATRAPTDTAGIQDTVQAALAGWPSGQVPAANVPAPVVFCTCPAAGSAGDASSPVIACTDPCPTGRARYVSVTVNQPFTPIFPTSSPFFSYLTTLGTTRTANVVARLQ